MTYCLRRLTPECNCFSCYARKTAEGRNAGLQAMHDLTVWWFCHGVTDVDAFLFDIHGMWDREALALRLGDLEVPSYGTIRRSPS